AAGRASRSDPPAGALRHRAPARLFFVSETQSSATRGIVDPVAEPASIGFYSLDARTDQPRFAAILLPKFTKADGTGRDKTVNRAHTQIRNDTLWFMKGLRGTNPIVLQNRR